MQFDNAFDLAQLSTPADPPSGRTLFYAKSNGRVYTKNLGIEIVADGTRWGTTSTWAFADNTNVPVSFADGGQPRVGDLVVSTNGFSYGEVYAITAVTGSNLADVSGVLMSITTVPGSPWTAVTYNANWADFGSFSGVQYRRAQYSKKGTKVKVVGSSKRTSGSTVSPFTLPSDFRPPTAIVGLFNSNNTPAQYVLGTDGVLTFGSVVSTQIQSFDIEFDTTELT